MTIIIYCLLSFPDGWLFQEQLERAQELQDCALEAQAYGNLGIAKLNMGHYEDAIGYLEQVKIRI